MKLKIISVFFLVCAYPALLTFGAPPPEAGLSLQQEGKNRSLLKATPPSGHHFSVKASHYLELEGFRGRIPPALVKESEIRFLLSGYPPRPFEVTLYICDNAKTFCAKQRLKRAWDEKKMGF